MTATRGEEGSERSGPAKLPCQRAGCKQFSLQLDPITLNATKPMNVSQSDGSHQASKVVHAAPRCERCRGFFCMT